MTDKRSVSPKPVAKQQSRLEKHDWTAKDPASLMHELHVYHEQLRTQNDALLRAQAELEATRDRFIDLYEFAPLGYLTLDDNGVVRQVNLTAALMLGRSKQALDGYPLLGSIGFASRNEFL